jgi:type IV secretory pathway TrbD component
MPRMSVYALLVIRSLLVFNGLLLTLVGFVLAVFMERPAGVVFAAVCWVTAGALFGLTRFADRMYERRP